MQELDSGDSDEEDPCKYFQIQACGPNGIADADGGFAKRLYETCSKYAAKNTASNPAGFMLWPGDLAKSKWAPGEISLSGGDNYLVPFGAQASQEQKKQDNQPIHPQEQLKATKKEQSIVEWKGHTTQTDKGDGKWIQWTDGYIGDISRSNLMRLCIKGKSDTWMTFAEEKDQFAKKINFVLGGWGNKFNGVHWQQKGEKGKHGWDWHRGPGSPYGWNGKSHKGEDQE